MYWRKIEEAPRDGRRLLLGATLDGGRDLCVLGRWEPYGPEGEDEKEDGRWMVVAADGAGMFEVRWAPTHFCRWETPATVEERAAAQVERRFRQREYDKLVVELTKASYHYYVKASPIMEDVQFDRMFRRLRDMEESGSICVDPQSPGQRVLGETESDYPEYCHVVA